MSRETPRVRLQATFGTPEFKTEYFAAVTSKPTVAKGPRGGAGTFEWLWGKYCESSAWIALAKATQRQRENIMKHVLTAAGRAPFAEISRQSIVYGREMRKATPSQANNYLATLTGLFAWAVKDGHMKANPAAGVETLARPKGQGFPDWTEADVQKFEKRWPLGTREHLALMILLHTGLRRGDAARLGRQHFRDGEIKIRAEKNGYELTIPIAPELTAAIAATRTGALTLVAKANGAGMVKEGFGNWFGEAARAAGVEKNAHGLRKLAATLVANNGASEAQLMALFGWDDPAMARHYTRQANRIRLAREAAKKLKRNEA